MNARLKQERKEVFKKKRSAVNIKQVLGESNERSVVENIHAAMHSLKQPEIWKDEVRKLLEQDITDIHTALEYIIDAVLKRSTASSDQTTSATTNFDEEVRSYLFDLLYFDTEIVSQLAEMLKIKDADIVDKK
jgi:chromatin segregation and condensation protein Rec8/ScpA/Scc1 (kleisin family)